MIIQSRHITEVDLNTNMFKTGLYYMFGVSVLSKSLCYHHHVTQHHLHHGQLSRLHCD